MDAPKDLGDWLSAGEASRILGLSTVTTRRLAETGMIRSYKTALGLLFDPKSVEQLRKARAALNAS